MKRTTIVTAAGAALLAFAGSAFATPSEPVPVSLLTVPSLAVQTPPADLAVTTWESIRYRPRHRDRDRDRDRDPGWRYSSPSRRASSTLQLHGGFFDPDGDLGRSSLLGIRALGGTDERLRFGVGIDWQHRADSRTAIVSEDPLPGGGTTERQRELARSSSNLFPIMATLEFMPVTDAPVLPYFGVSGGYEALFISAEDFGTGDKFDGTFGGWGWQAYVGAAMPLSGNARITGELFSNSAEVDREIDDPAGRVREIVDLDGIGMRFGVNWNF